MADPIVLDAVPALDAPGGHRDGMDHEAAYALEIGRVTLIALDARSVRTVAFGPAEAEALERLVGTSLPPPGLSATNESGHRLLGVQRDQLWLLDADTVDTTTESNLWWVDQSDGWTTLAIEGEDVFAVLERLCPVDLDANCFPIGSVARTVIEHLAVVVVRTGERRFELLTPRSSVVSFAHAIESAAAHVAAERELRASSLPD